MVDPVALRAVSSTSIPPPEGKPRPAGQLATYLRGRGYQVEEQPISGGRFNVFATLDAPPEVVFSTHVDCVPPFFPSREERGLMSAVAPATPRASSPRRWRRPSACASAGEGRFGLLFVSGEERGSDGAQVANAQAPDSVRFLINGEPTDNRLGLATRGLLSRAPQCHRACGALVVSRAGRVGHRQAAGRLDGGARCDVARGSAARPRPLHRGPHRRRRGAQRHLAARLGRAVLPDGRQMACRVREALGVVESLVAIEHVLDIPAIRMHTLPDSKRRCFRTRRMCRC